MTDKDHESWEKFRKSKFYAGGESSRASKFYKRLAELAGQTGLTKEKQFLIEELQLYAESILPDPN